MQAAGIALLIGCAASAAILAKAKTWWNRAVERTYARWVVGLASAWLVLASIWGPAQLAILGLLAAGTIAGMIPWYLHKLPRPKDNALLLKWQQKWIEVRDRLGLEGSRVVAVKGDDDYVTLTLQLIPGVQEAAEVKAVRLRIAGAWGLSVSAIRIEEVERDASKVTVAVRIVNPLSGGVTWEETKPLLPTSVNKPFIVGRSETGEWKKVDARGHWMLNGVSRAGKSNFLSVLLGNLAATDDALVFLIDMKGGLAGRWHKAADWVAIEVDEAELMLNALDNVVKVRQRAYMHLSKDGDQIVPTPKLPAIFVVVDEYAATAGSSAERTSSGSTLVRTLTRLKERGAGSAVYMIESSQDGSLETLVSEKSRAQATRRVCFRVEKVDHAEYTLGMDAHKLEPTTLQDGEFFLRVGGNVDQTPIRAQFMTDPEVDEDLPQQIAAEWATRRPRLDRASVEAAGVMYATRASRLPRELAPANTPAEQPEPTVTTPERSPAPMAYAEDDQSPAAMAARIEAESGLHDANVIPITAETMAMLRSRPGFDAEAHAAIASAEDRMAMAFTNAINGIDRKSLIDFVGMSSSWVDERTKALKEAGAVTQAGHGRYQAVPGADIRQALDAYAERKRSVHSA
jgi:hypothetical protein